MEKITIAFLALLSANAFAFDADQKWDADQAQKHDQWQQEAEARRDEFMRNYKPNSSVTETCVSSVEAQATAILGEDSRKHISVLPNDDGTCTFYVTEFEDWGRGCENLRGLSAVAKKTFDQDEICRFEAEKWKVYLDYRDIIYTSDYTDSLQQEHQARLKPIEHQHMQNMIKLINTQTTNN